MEKERIVRSVAESLSRRRLTKSQVASGIDLSPVKRQMNRLSNPKSPSSTLKKAGVALIVGTPDPVTAVPGVALIAASYMMKKKDPAKLSDLAAEARKILRDIQSLSL